MKALRGYDIAALAYLGVLTLIVLIARPPGTLYYLLGHGAAAGVVFVTAATHAKVGGRWWTLARIWYIVPFILCAFRELHYLVPQVHNFDDHRYDRILAGIDRAWLGDVDAFCLRMLNPAAADVLHVCYWSYYVSLAILGAWLHRRGEWGRLDEYATVVLTALLVSYLGYLVVPAVGPHHFYPARPAVLDGWLIGGPLHRTMLALELRMPDAFPSGHTLMSLVLMYLARKHAPARAFWAVVPLAAGCILATVVLRYHYVVDVAASFALFPAVVWLGLALNRWRAPEPRVLTN
jgi:membrane-associated phospholipid phosphatase